MGGDDNQAWRDEYPKHEVVVDSFWMDGHEVTNAQFAAFVEATDYITTAEKAIGDNLKILVVLSLEKKITLLYMTVGLMLWPIAIGLANDSQQRLNGNMPVEVGLKIQSILGVMKALIKEIQRPIPGKVAFPTETKNVMGFTFLHLLKIIRQMAMSYTIWLETYGNGALI